MRATTKSRPAAGGRASRKIRQAWVLKRTIPLLLGAFCAFPGHASELTRLSEQILPEQLSWALDIRWGDADQLVIAAGRQGVFGLSAGAAPPEVKRIVGGNTDTNGFWFAARLARSPEYLVVASPVHNLTWLRAGASTPAPAFPIAAITDLDVRGDRLVVLGARRGDDPQSTWSPDSAIAWLGSLDHDLQDLRPILYSVTEHGQSMADCSFFEHGGARFLRDGSLLVIPGVEDGVFLFDAQGKLQRTWEADQVGLDVGCGPAADPQNHSRFARDWRLRHVGFLNQRRILDEILDLPQGPGLVVRTVAAGTTRWQLRTLPLHGGPATVYDLPVTSPSPFSHLRGDVADTPPHPIALLLLEYRDLTQVPAVTPKVIVTEVPDEQTHRAAEHADPARPLGSPTNR